MANWTQLTADIHERIRDNTTGEITGDVLQYVLDSMVTALGATSGFKGVALTTTTSPGALDGTAFYLASDSGVYSGFGITIARKGIYVFEHQNGTWTSKTLYVVEDVSIQPYLNNTLNISLSDNTLTFGSSGFTLLVGTKKYLISGNADYTFARVAAVRGFLYFNLDNVKGKADGYSVNWTTNNPFIVTNENLSTSGNYYLIASYYTDEIFINDPQLGFYLNYKAIKDGLNFPNQNKIYQQFGTLFCSALPQVYVSVDTTLNTITIPIGFSVIGLTSKNRYTTTAEQTCSVIPVNIVGVPQISTLSVLLFNTTDLTFTNLLYSETQPANTIIVGIVRRTELSSSKTGDVYIWGLENYKVDGVIKGSVNNIIDRNRDVENLVLAAIGAKDGSRRYTFAQIADVHGQVSSMVNLAYYVNNYTVDAVYQCGDMNPSNEATPISDQMFAAIDRLTKPIYPVVGNHDKGNGFLKSTQYNNTEVYNTYIAPFIVQDGTTRITPAGTNLSYYYVDNSTYKIRSIFLNEFDNDREYGIYYSVSRGYRCFSQAQITWLCNTLKTTPSGYHALIVLHQPPFYLADESIDLSRSSYSYQGTIEYQANQTSPGWILLQIVNAYLNKLNLSSSPQVYGFMPDSAGITSGAWADLEANDKVTLNYNFSSPTNPSPAFIGYFCGHCHADIVAFATDSQNIHPVLSPKQAIIMVTTGNSAVSTSSDDDLPRISNTKSQDAFNICSVDTLSKKLYIVKVGSNTGRNLVERKSVVVNYGTGEFENDSLGELTTNSFSINGDGELILTY